MKNFSLLVVGLLIGVASYSQTTLKNHTRGTLLVHPDSTHINDVVEHIYLQNRKYAAHQDSSRLIKDVDLLYSNLCYRELIDRSTAKAMYLLVECTALHARKGLYFQTEK